ncbi:hypothetical protein GCM10010869_44520 [Mesorhizobium tianshanense]|uniref:Uncharacterized protein n=1 Tax=Mesorhizobium tianshanense TaxID=39844 RepID=A0A562N7W3_9HYPH|nr:hypothetical protein IQ26_05309 [Mesorhizobium tianshanense]GLS38855.1 hypothetical protein GCM10010869_44520 [Mesorhizobium tianshanense]
MLFAHLTSKAIAMAASLWGGPLIASALQALVTELFDPYRPELHYMRGPGPKWREKHAHLLARRQTQAR